MASDPERPGPLERRLDALQRAIEAQGEEHARALHALRDEIAGLRAELASGAHFAPRPATGRLERLKDAGRHLPGFVQRPLRRSYHGVRAVLSPTSRQQVRDLQAQRALFREILEAKRDGCWDVVVMPIIDWHFRIQRPQHLARSLAAEGNRIFYLTTTFSPYPGQAGFNVLESPAENVYVCQLYCPEPHPRIYQASCRTQAARELALGVEVLADNFYIEQAMCLVQYPFWRHVAERIRGGFLVYDRMDHHAGFTTATQALVEEEEYLLEQADLVITTAESLTEGIPKRTPTRMIRNAAEVDHFVEPPAKLALRASRPVVGYFGAISSWFDIDLVVDVARRFPEWDFVLVGSTFECDTEVAKGVANIRFTGEVPYAELPSYLHAFDVCIIPFQITDLIRSTNPVKVYEYLSAGKPVVATRIPEVVRLGEELVRTAETADEFAEKLALAMAEKDDEALAGMRARWASEHTWTSRAKDLADAIGTFHSRVSVVVLAYNNLEMTRACLHSVERHSGYPNLELIVVDNGSTDGTREFLAGWETQVSSDRLAAVRVILNDENLGFAAGNNVGIRASTGDYVVLLNNDTYVTRGWLLDLVRHFRETPALGLVGPVTNNIGNEAKIEIDYASMIEMSAAARRYTVEHPRELLLVDNVAFFCVAVSRAVLDEVGLLDEDFGIGFFEDDDYCHRVRSAGYQIGIAENVFVHHHLSASFDMLGTEERDAIFRRNKQIFEKKWGEWKPHRYRRDA